MTNFLQAYEKIVAPKLMEIDLFLKCAEYPLSIEDVSSMLQLSHGEVRDIMDGLGIARVGVFEFLSIMQKGSSWICRLYQREVATGSPYTYTHDQLAYIYGLEPKHVEEACQKVGVKEVTPFTMPLIFAKISIDPKNLQANSL